MANVKISDLPSAASAAGTQEFEVNDSGTSRKVTGSQMLTYIAANHTHTVSEITDAGTAASADVADIEATALALSIALG